MVRLCTLSEKWPITWIELSHGITRTNREMVLALSRVGYCNAAFTPLSLPLICLVLCVLSSLRPVRSPGILLVVVHHLWMWTSRGTSILCDSSSSPFTSVDLCTSRSSSNVTSWTINFCATALSHFFFSFYLIPLFHGRLIGERLLTTGLAINHSPLAESSLIAERVYLFLRFSFHFRCSGRRMCVRCMSIKGFNSFAIYDFFFSL